MIPSKPPAARFSKRRFFTVITRREMNSTLAIMLAAVFSEGAGPLLHAAAPPQEATQGHAATRSGVGVQTLMREPLAEMPNPEVSVITLTVAPGATSSPHEHTGPVFAYLLEGEIENQVDPNPPQRYKPGEFFYEPPMHVHRMLRNLSETQPAKLLIFQVGEKGKQFTLRAK
jgi:quercetin dioxygenase-like cupin family protein